MSVWLVVCLEDLFGSKNRERVLLFLLANYLGYARQIADFEEAQYRCRVENYRR